MSEHECQQECGKFVHELKEKIDSYMDKAKDLFLGMGYKPFQLVLLTEQLSNGIGSSRSYMIGSEVVFTLRIEAVPNAIRLTPTFYGRFAHLNGETPS